MNINDVKEIKNPMFEGLEPIPSKYGKAFRKIGTETPPKNVKPTFIITQKYIKQCEEERKNRPADYYDFIDAIYDIPDIDIDNIFDTLDIDDDDDDDDDDWI